MERHVQSVLLAIATTALIALATFTFRTQETLARLDERVGKITMDVEAFKQTIASVAGSAETKDTHSRDINRIEAAQQRQDERIRELETRSSRR